MSFKDVLVLVTPAVKKAALAAVDSLAQCGQTHISVLHITELPAPLADAYGVSGNLWVTLLDDARKAGKADRDKIAESLSARSAQISMTHIEAVTSAIGPLVADRALYADLTVLEQASTPLYRNACSGVLFNSGRPVLLLPPDWRSPALGRRILVAWAEKREAARAVADAMPFLAAADSVKFLTVRGVAPAADDDALNDLETYLQRHGIRAEIEQVIDQHREPESVLLEEAHKFGADMLVMGAYGHSRLQEFVFGGVTHNFVKHSPVPVFMSH